jgi:pilus assembly protein CpaB
MNQESKNLWMAVLFAVIAAGLLYSHIQEKNKSIAKKFGAKNTVVVAKKDIDELTPINDTHIELKEMPVDFISPGSIKDMNDVIGKVALAPFVAGESIIQNKIVKPSPLTGLSLQVSPGKRALTIPIDSMRGVAKLLKPGDRVDLIASILIGTGQNKKKIVKTVMQNVPILATGVKISNELPVLYEKNKRGDEIIVKNLTRDTNFASITIEASPVEAQNIIYILNDNPKNLFLSLRHPSDTGPIPVNVNTSTESIIGRKIRRPASNNNSGKRAR